MGEKTLSVGARATSARERERERRVKKSEEE